METMYAGPRCRVVSHGFNMGVVRHRAILNGDQAREREKSNDLVF